MERKLTPQRTSAVSLVLVLGMLALLSIIVIAFLSNVSTDLAASRSYEDQSSTRALADSAVNLVIAQIREASTDGTRAWISQPGLIRTFTGSSPEKAYKLYSDDTMEETGAFDPAAPLNQAPLDWGQKPNLYTDLNAPVFKNGTAVFPVLDGNAIKERTVAGNKALIYDADGDGLPDVEGFSIDPSRVKYQPGEPLSTRNNPVAMPVKWLYLLKDGTLVSAKARPGSYDVEVGDAKGKPTAVNPIIARVAFWADDDTAKVNLNTASEGTFWDTPVGVGYPSGGQAAAKGTDFDPAAMSEADLAYKQGAQREFQRYPGHPATTSLSPVLGPTLRGALGLSANPRGLDRYKLVKAMTDLVPRVTDDNVSSQGGTKRAGSGSATNAKVAYDNDRLFATPDEMFFSSAFISSTRQTPLGTNAKPLMTDEQLRKLVERTRFFLTTTSKAPEQNLFNKPRVAIWPINSAESKRTTFDKLIAFCGTVNNGPGAANARPFYFTRSDPTSATADYAGIPRNKQIYQYLQKLTAQTVPGFGLDFAAKYPNDRDQILTEIFDYIRCTNLADTSEGAAKTYTPGAETADAYVTKRGQVVPITIGTTRGFGRIATISELGLVMTKLKDPTIVNATTWDPALRSRLEFTLMPELFCPMAGFSALADDIRLTFETVDITVTDKNGASYTPFKAPGATQPDLYVAGRISNPQDHASKVGGNIGLGTLCEIGNAGGSAQATITTPADSVPPNGKITIAGTSPSSGKPSLPTELVTISGTVTVSVRAPATGGPQIQKFTFNFPSQKVPIPAFAAYGSGEQELAAGTGGATGSKVKGYRLNNSSGYKLESFIQGKDTIRSLAATGRLTANGAPLMGDMRLIAASAEIGGGAFQPTVNYNDVSRAQAHSFRNGFRYVFDGATFGKLASTPPGVDYLAVGGNTNGPTPDIPDGWLDAAGKKILIDGVKNAYNQPGDWDNGQGLTLDGPYLNKADEGTDGAGGVPYIGEWWFAEGIAQQMNTFFSPNRQLPSAGMFGSLSTGVKSGLPWQTLLFRPAKSYLPGGRNHPGGDAPSKVDGSIGRAVPDHVLLDLFWMPVVEPYAISEPFATAGKINLNYQIAPFTYIKRDTGLRAVLASTMITAINPSQKTSTGHLLIQDFKLGDLRPEGALTRRQIDADSTLRQFDELRFKAGVNKPFISASELCDIPLIPKDAQGAANTGISNSTQVSNYDSALGAFWNSHRLTGDNSLERPYTLIYPRVTTKSNSYTVHVRVQTLRKAPADRDQAIFKDNRDQVLGEFRGSFVIERYLDANSAGFYLKGDPAKPSDETDPNAVLGPYRFRVVTSKQFGL